MILLLYGCKKKLPISISCVCSKGVYTMNAKPIFTFVLPFLLLCSGANAQKLTSDMPYVKNGHERHVLDIYTPEEPAGKPLPVMFWIHGGGWQVGDKSDVALKPKSENGRPDRRRSQVARLGA
ncbi:MAG: hypothetical protein ACYSWZ_06860 [Planctomycetota bacterium]|jgi:hypothetical protein